MTELNFGEKGMVTASLSENARGLVGSEILKIASDIRQMKAEGRQVCNLTVGDFDPTQFPIPAGFRDRCIAALKAGQTNYPPSDGLLSLREAVTEFVERNWGVRYPVESVMIASGARPILYGAYRTVVDRGEKVVYPVPSWNNNHYCWMSRANAVEITTRPEDGFMPTMDQLRPHMDSARMISLNSPLNPTGTVIAEEALAEILHAIVEENDKRTRSGKPHLFLLHDQIYSLLLFGKAKHVMPAAVVPEAAPWIISLDGASKGFAATGLRVGWVLAAPELTLRMKARTGHVGAWAPRPEQEALAGFLRDADAQQAYQEDMNRRVRERLNALYTGFNDLKAQGYPVDCIAPQGAIYLSLRLDLFGRTLDGVKIERNEQIRRALLDRAGVGIIAFQAFGLEEETGWFRLSVGSVSMDEIAEAMPRIKAVFDQMKT